MSDLATQPPSTKFYVKLSLGCLLGIVTWTVVVFVTAFYGWWMQPVAQPGDTDAFFNHARTRLETENPGVGSMAIMTNGELSAQFYASSGSKEINQNTVFSTASMSKLFSAYGVMKLVQDGRLDLDTPVSTYLTRWQLPQKGFNNDGVTIRRLLSHTAGLEDGLGFGDYLASETLPGLEESLSNVRASSGEPVEIAVSAQPGAAFQYSGGGYLLLELIVEEVTNQSFDAYMQETIFTPLGMRQSGYDYLDSLPNNAGSFDRNGESTVPFQYASKAATAFVTSTSDLVSFAGALISDQNQNAPLSVEAVRSMRQPHGKTTGIDIWGLGTILYAAVGDTDHVFGHDGGNDPAINTALRINPQSRDAIIVMVTGHPSLATNIGSDWVLWQTGSPDVLDSEAVIKSMYLPIGIGSAFLVLIAVVFGYRRRVQHA